jgi:hypothetical protein
MSSSRGPRGIVHRPIAPEATPSGPRGKGDKWGTASRPSPDADVLRGYKWSGDQQTVRFDADVWPLSKLFRPPNTRVTDLHWQTVPDDFREPLREFLYARIHHPLPGQQRPHVRTVGHYFDYLRRAARLFVEDGIDNLHDLTQARLDRWRKHLSVKGDLSPKSIVSLLVYIRMLGQYRKRTVTDGLCFEPWRHRNLNRMTGAPSWSDRAENSTPRIPYAVWQPLVTWALRYVEDFADEVLTAYDQSRDPKSLELSFAPKGKNSAQRIGSLVECFRAEGRGLPDRSPYDGGTKPTSPSPVDPVNLAAVARLLGPSQRLPTGGYYHREDFSPGTAGRAALCEAVQELGLEGQVARDRREDSLVAHVGWGLHGVFCLMAARHLQTACYIVIAAIGGMRDSEIQAIHFDAYKPYRSEDGMIEGWEVSSIVYKHQGESGTPEKWVVVEEVVTALKVLEKIRRIDGHTTGYVFRLLGYDRPIKDSILTHLNNFLEHVNLHLASYPHRRKGTVSVPEWDLTTMQFRRTLALFFNTQPDGPLAARWHFKHVQTVVSEGYCGNLESGFPQDLEAEENRARLASFTTLFEDFEEGVDPVGGAATRLIPMFKRIAKVRDLETRDAMLRVAAKDYRPGMLNDCDFDPSTAPCTEGTGGVVPLFNFCSPDTCGNSVLRPEHRRLWAAHASSLESQIDLLEQDQSDNKKLSLPMLSGGSAQLQVLRTEHKKAVKNAGDAYAA